MSGSLWYSINHFALKIECPWLFQGKIHAVHMAAREGNLRDLQSALDRRKFAVARDGSSPRGATPLHVAVVFGNTTVIRYSNWILNISSFIIH